jgi:hypothetical protein
MCPNMRKDDANSSSSERVIDKANQKEQKIRVGPTNTEYGVSKLESPSQIDGLLESVCACCEVSESENCDGLTMGKDLDRDDVGCEGPERVCLLR